MKSRNLTLAAFFLTTAVVAESSSLGRTVANAGQRGPEWLAYRVPLAATQAFMCCFSRDFRVDTCRLEGREHGWGSTGERRDEPTGELQVLLRVEKGRVGRVRAVTGSCGIDAKPLELTWLDGIVPGESVAFLSGLIHRADPDSENNDRLMAALALHQEGALELITLLKRTKSAEIRRKALFWLGQSDDPRAFEELERILGR